MNRDFEIRPLLRAYRSGIMTEAAFEEEIARIEHETARSDPAQAGFEALGRLYHSEREAVIRFLDELHATQMETAVGFARWAAVCRTPSLKTGLNMIAERDAYHARVLERRCASLVESCTATQRKRVPGWWMCWVIASSASSTSSSR